MTILDGIKFGAGIAIGGLIVASVLLGLMWVGWFAWSKSVDAVAKDLPPS